MKELESPLRICSVCEKKQEMIVNFLDTKKKVPVMCKCQEEEYELKKEEDLKKQKQLRLEKLRKYSLMDESFKSCTFDSFEVDDNNRKLFKIAKNYTKKWTEMKADGIGLMFYGPPGIGKSYMSFCIANDLIDRLVPVIAISTISLINRIYDSYGKWGDQGEIEIINSLNNADLLVLDDLGAEHSSRNGKEKQIIYSVIDGRSRNKKPTIVTTNLDLLQLKEKLTGTDGIARTYDRLVEVCQPIEVKGQSRRVISARKKQKDILNRLLTD